MRHEPYIVEMRAFSVQDCATGECQTVTESSFEAAAMGFLEQCHCASEGEIRLEVVEQATGLTEHFCLHA